MKIKNIMLFIFLITSQIFSQSNQIYLGGLGAGLGASLNYERQLSENGNLFLRGGYGMFSVENTSIGSSGNGIGLYTTKVSINPVIMGIHYLKGNKFKLDLGLGMSYWMISVEGDGTGALGGFDFGTEGSYANFYATIGLRYQNPNGGLTFALGLSPTQVSVENESGTLPLPHFNLGYSF